MDEVEDSFVPLLEEPKFQVPARELFVMLRSDAKGDEALETARLMRWPFTWMSLGRQSAQATMKPSVTSASVQRPMKRALCATSASE